MTLRTLYALYALHFTLCTGNFAVQTLYTLYLALHTQHFTLHSSHSTLHFTLHTLHFNAPLLTHDTPNPTLYILRFAQHT